MGEIYFENGYLMERSWLCATVYLCLYCTVHFKFWKVSFLLVETEYCAWEVFASV